MDLERLKNVFPDPCRIRRICTQDQLAAFQQAGPLFDVEVTVVAEAGNPYAHISEGTDDHLGKVSTSTISVVRDGEVYI